jgi:4-alpha-glucanotransferase
VLGVGGEGRMNLPGTSSGNWRWRYRAEELTVGIGGRLKQMAQVYDR